MPKVRNTSRDATAHVSVVLPVFNGEAFVAEALDSIVNQTCSPKQVIVVDDGSTDATPAVVASFGDTVEMVRQENQGPAAALNAGIGRARHRYLAFCDADDRWDLSKLEVQLAQLELRPDLDAVFAHAREFLDLDPALQLESTLRRPFESAPAWVAGAALVRKAAFDRVGGFDATLPACEFLDWIARARDAGLQLAMTDEVLLERRLHGANLTADDGYRRVLAETLQTVMNRRRTAS